MKKYLSLYLNLIVTLLFLISLIPPVWAEIPPRPVENPYVHDLANMLTTEHTGKMRAIGSSIEKASGAEIVVVTVENLGKNTIEEFANQLFRSWGIGDKEKNNGILLLVNKENVMTAKSGRVRIEVGYGLEGAIPDGKAGRILDEFVLPYWEELDYSRGIYQGYMAIAKAVADEYGLELAQDQVLGELENYTIEDSSDFDQFPFEIIIFILILLAMIFFNNRGGGARNRGNRTFGNPYPRGPFYRGPFGGGSFRGSSGFGGRSGGGGFGGFGGGSSGGGGASR